MSLTQTPRGNRVHIGIFGKRNSGKSSLLNALTNQKIAVVSSHAGTTTDPVYKAMEIHGIGACVFIDTAGFDDFGEIGEMRVEKTQIAAQKTDIAIMVLTDDDLAMESSWMEFFAKKSTPVLVVVNKCDSLDQHISESIKNHAKEHWNSSVIFASTITGKGMMEIKQALVNISASQSKEEPITAGLVEMGDVVMLVMPQDLQAPKGRLILPQVQTIRELLDKKAIIISTVTSEMEAALATMIAPPKLIITDSQVFGEVWEKKPKTSLLTSFSVLFAAQKGDIDYFLAGAKAIANLTSSSKVLIAEACTHAPLSEDIGREKIPNMLRKRYGKEMKIDVASGDDFPNDLSKYDLIIHCGGCMFNKKYILSRVKLAKANGTKMTNYGIAIAFLTGILDKIDF